MVEPKKLIYWSCNYEHTSCQLQLWCKAIFLFCCIKCWDMKNEYWLLHKNKTLIPICQNHLNNLVSFQVAHDLPRHTHLPWFDYPSRPPPHLILHCIFPRNAIPHLFHKLVHSLHRPHYHEPNVSWHQHLRDPVMRLLSLSTRIFVL
jgi:hypothetical protein